MCHEFFSGEERKLVSLGMANILEALDSYQCLQ